MKIKVWIIINKLTYRKIKYKISNYYLINNIKLCLFLFYIKMILKFIKIIYCYITKSLITALKLKYFWAI